VADGGAVRLGTAGRDEVDTGMRLVLSVSMVEIIAEGHEDWRKQLVEKLQKLPG
jgi:hypothetical protein